uniref:Polyketide synthase n=1 Tax=Peronospora matthiolae TaxID=2874970 RepID=A0AAV1VKN0_9STRA
MTAPLHCAEMTAPLCRNDSSTPHEDGKRNCCWLLMRCAEMTAPVRVLHVVHSLPICAEMTAPVRVPHVVHSLPMSGCIWEAHLLLDLDSALSCAEMTGPLCRNDSSTVPKSQLQCAEMTAPVRVPHVVHSLPMSGCMSVLASNTARRWEAQLLLALDAVMQ